MTILRTTSLSAAALAALLAGGAADAREPADIGQGRILEVEIGMTLAEARAATPWADWRYEPAFMVDFSADCVEHEGETLFCALVFEEETFTASARVESLVALSAKLSAPGDVRVGMKLTEVEQVWGDATLAFSWANEGREFVSFASAPSGLSIRGDSATAGDAAMGAHIGLYPEETRGEEYQETKEYHADAVVSSIWAN